MANKYSLSDVDVVDEVVLRREVGYGGMRFLRRSLDCDCILKTRTVIKMQEKVDQNEGKLIFHRAGRLIFGSVYVVLFDNKIGKNYSYILVFADAS